MENRKRGSTEEKLLMIQRRLRVVKLLSTTPAVAVCTLCSFIPSKTPRKSQMHRFLPIPVRRKFGALDYKVTPANSVFSVQLRKRGPRIFGEFPHLWPLNVLSKLCITNAEVTASDVPHNPNRKNTGRIHRRSENNAERRMGGECRNKREGMAGPLRI